MPFRAYAQRIVPTIEWVLRDGLTACEFQSVAKTGDGGFILGGRIYDISDPLQRGNECVLAKVNAQGVLQWRKEYGGDEDDFVRAVRPTSDGGYIFTASSDSAPSGNKESPHYGREDAWVVKVDGDGNKQWEKTFGGVNEDSLSMVSQTADGGYLLAGYSPDAFGGSDAWLIKIDANGSKAWERFYGGSGKSESFSSFRQTADGFILAGSSWSQPANEGESPLDGWLVKVNAQGNKEWERSFGGAEENMFVDVDVVAEGGFIAAGSIGSMNTDGNDHWIVKVDATGNKEWERSFGSESVNERIVAIHETSDEGYIMGGDAEVIKTDSRGEIQWEEFFGNDSRTNEYVVEIKDLQLTADGGYIACGNAVDSFEGVSARGCVEMGWAAKLRMVLSQAGEVVTWNGGSEVVLESVDDLNGEWKNDASEVLSIGGAKAISLIPTGQQHYYRIREAGSTNNAPALSIGGLLCWPANQNHVLELSTSKEGEWSAFSGDEGRIGDMEFAIIPENLRGNYFRTVRQP